ncbi:MAG: aspartate-semialdehyde dehydrogenase [Myxococcaceae bacterium]|nr:aspartate-semialdehyde dehydrogenase [Myxococcaceae bacterium]
MIAIVGATGVLGTQLISALGRADHPVEELTLFASEKSVGTEVDVGGETLEVEPIEFRGIDVALFATPLAASRPLIDAALKVGTRVIDFSGAFRSDRSVPHGVPGLTAFPSDARVAGVAGAAGLTLSRALAPLHRAARVAWADVTALHGAGHRGRAGVEALEKQTAGLLSGRHPDSPEPFAQTAAFNVLPHVGAFAKAHPQSSEELATALDFARAVEAAPPAPPLRGAPNPAPFAPLTAPPVRVTALHVPVFHGLVLSVSLQLEGPLDVEAVRAALKGSSRVKVLDAPDEGIYPTALLTADDEAVHVGRIRVAGNHVWFVAAADAAALVASAGLELLTIWQGE